MFQSRRNSIYQFGWRYHLPIDMHQCNIYRIVAVKRHSSCQHFIHHDAQGVDIGFLVHIPSSCLFRREVVNRSDDPFCIVYYGRSIDRLGDTKVGDLSCTIGCDHNIVRLHIPVNDVILVSESQCCSDLLGQSDHFRIRHRTLLLDVIAERFPLDQLHYYVVDVSFPAYIIDIYDIRMGQARRRL